VNAGQSKTAPIGTPRIGGQRDPETVSYRVPRLIDRSAPHGFLIYFRNDVHSVMTLAGDRADCVAYLMGNHVTAERMFRHDPGAMMYAPCTPSSGSTRTPTRGSPSTSRARNSGASAFQRSRKWASS
jgi:hypothetical protein